MTVWWTERGWVFFDALPTEIEVVFPTLEFTLVSVHRSAVEYSRRRIDPAFPKPPEFLLLTTLSTMLSKTFSGYCRDVAIKPLNSSVPRTATPKRDVQESSILVSVCRLKWPCGLLNRSTSISALGVIILIARIGQSSQKSLTGACETLCFGFTIKKKNPSLLQRLYLQKWLKKIMTFSTEYIHSPAVCEVLSIGIMQRNMKRGLGLQKISCKQEK